MTIKYTEILVKELVNGYKNSDEEGVVAFGGKLDVRPKYQRNFIYEEKERNAVIDTILKEFPLNTMYWVKQGENYELLDGQQRTISIAMFANNEFNMIIGDHMKQFNNLTEAEKDIFLNYKLSVYVCEGTDKEQLDWFKTINIAGKPLTTQELRNAIYYQGEWITDAKRYFSKTGCAAYDNFGKYLNGVAIRQDYLETALAWIQNSRKDDAIEAYMSEHQFDKDADELKLYFEKVVSWVKAKFPKYRKEMKGLEWGLFYNAYKDKPLNANELEARIKELFMDDEVTSKKGIYAYLLSGDERTLSLRAFTESQKSQVYEAQGGLCANGGGVKDGGKGLKGVKCPHENEKLELTQMHADHIMPWSKGGKTELSNCQMLCRECNSQKSDKF